MTGLKLWEPASLCLLDDSKQIDDLNLHKLQNLSHLQAPIHKLRRFLPHNTCRVELIISQHVKILKHRHQTLKSISILRTENKAQT